MEAEARFSTWKECLEALPSPRMVGRTQHRLIDVLCLSLCDVTCCMDDFEAIEEWSNERLDWLRQFVELDHGTPSHDMLLQVLAALDSTQFESALWGG